MTQPIRCNLKDCPPHWEGHWTPCSATCGEGIQHFVPKCHQELSTGRQIVTNDMACPRPKPASQAKPCIQEPCDSIRDNELPQTPETSLRNIRQEWSVGPWSSVSLPQYLTKKYKMKDCICFPVFCVVRHWPPHPLRHLPHRPMPPRRPPQVRRILRERSLFGIVDRRDLAVAADRMVPLFRVVRHRHPNTSSRLFPPWQL
jgi:hypothetical protein